jgi:hypothetical protein
MDTVRRHLDQARDHITEAGRELTARPPELADLHAAVDGVIQVTNAVAELVNNALRAAPTVLEHNPVTLKELLADLRAAQGCLTTAPLLVAPARDDLHDLVFDTILASDLADQSRDVPALDPRP